MVASRIWPMGRLAGSFWLSAVCAGFLPTSIGYQDLAAFFARQPGVSERWREHLIASPFGTIHAATFSFVRPLGTAMPAPSAAQPVNFDPHSLDVKAWSDEPPTAQPALWIEYPTVNRHLKGDRMPLPQSPPGASEPRSLPQLQPIEAPTSSPAHPPGPAGTPRPKDAEQLGPTLPATDAVSDQRDQSRNRDVDGGSDDALLGDMPPDVAAVIEGTDAQAAPSPSASLSYFDENAVARTARLYFGAGAMGAHGGLEQRASGAAPVLASPSVDPDLKLSALQGRAGAAILTVARRT